MNKLEKEINYPCTLTIIAKPGKSIITCSRKKGDEIFFDTYEIEATTYDDTVEIQIKFTK